MWVEMRSRIIRCWITLVILFVRMWVEININWSGDFGFESSSSWGCELKCSECKKKMIRRPVILFVRMWVEIIVCSVMILLLSCHPLREDVSWNSIWYAQEFPSYIVILFVRMWVEIIMAGLYTTGLGSHPLREDVSWNNQSENMLKLWFRSSSSWGCELKYSRVPEGCRLYRHPLREDVSWNVEHGVQVMCVSCHPLREDVSWNICHNIHF